MRGMYVPYAKATGTQCRDLPKNVPRFFTLITFKHVFLWFWVFQWKARFSRFFTLITFCFLTFLHVFHVDTFPAPTPLVRFTHVEHFHMNVATFRLRKSGQIVSDFKNSFFVGCKMAYRLHPSNKISKTDQGGTHRTIFYKARFSRFFTFFHVFSRFFTFYFHGPKHVLW